MQSCPLEAERLNTSMKPHNLFLLLGLTLFALVCLPLFSWAQSSNNVEVDVTMPGVTVAVSTNGVPVRQEVAEVDLQTGISAMVRQVLNSPGSLMVIIALTLICILIERTPKIDSSLIPWICIIGGALSYFLFSKKSSVPADFPYPAAVLFVNGMICGAAAWIGHAQVVQRFFPTVTKQVPVWLMAFGMALALGTSACRIPSLEPGGAYAPTNTVGAVVYSDVELALVDASHKFAYETIDSVFAFEKSHREQVKAISPEVYLQVKHAMDDARKKAWEVEKRWATARKIYMDNPTPEGLTTVQQILAEFQRLLPVIQSQLTPVNALLTAPKTPTPSTP